MRVNRLTMLMVLFCLTGTASAQQDCEQARVLDDQARNLAEKTARLAAYQQITSLCPNFNYLYKLGRAWQDSGDHAQAKRAYAGAREVVGDKRAQGMVMGRLAQTHLALNELADALAMVDEAVTLTAPEVPDWLANARRQIDLTVADAPLSADFISRAFSAKRSYGVRPRLNLNIQFTALRDSLTDEGRRQVAELGKSLASQPGNAKVRLTGHTDGGGDSFVAYRLSFTRAERVAETLLSDFPSLAGRVNHEGRGGREPRYAGESDDDNKLNRRVEVVLE